MTMRPSRPPEIPKRSLAPLVVAALGGIAIVGVLVWKLTWSASEASEPPEEKEAAVATVAALPPPAAMPAPDPPPPPPEEEAPRSAHSDVPSRPGAVEPELTPRAPPVKRDPNCDDPCNGKETPELSSAFRAKAGQARACYEKALSNNSALAGKLEVSVRVSRTGSACSASVGKDGLGDAGVVSCVLSRFRGGKYPLPTGGCVDVSVQINFMPAGSR